MDTKAKNESLKLKVYSLLGHKTDISYLEIRKCTFQLGFPLFLILVIAMLVLFDTHGYVVKIGFGRAVIVWSVNIVAITALYIALLSGLIWLKKRLQWLVAYLPLVGFISMTICTFLSVAHVSVYLAGPVDWRIALQNLPFNLSMGLIFETLFFIYVKPALLRNSELKMSERVVSTRSIRVAGENIDIADIIYLRAQDHYVDLFTKNGKEMIRARMLDFTSQLSTEEGVMPHRSYWVAWHQIAFVEITPNYASLTMHCGSVVPIAKGRTNEIELGAKIHL